MFYKGPDLAMLYKGIHTWYIGSLDNTQESLSTHLGLLTDRLRADIEIDAESRGMYKDISKEVEEAAENIVPRCIINLRGRKSMITRVEHVLKEVSINFKEAGDPVKAYKKSRLRSITLVTDNNTLTGYENFGLFKNNLTLIRKFLCSSEKSPVLKINGRAIRVHIRNIALLTGDRELSA